MAWQLLKQLSNGYRRGASTMTLPTSFDEYLDATGRPGSARARARRLGYRFDMVDRRRHEQDVYDINTSAPQRQGRPMSAGYHERPRFSDNPIVCPLHHVYTYGVLRHDRLVAYLWLYRCGDLAMVSSILGHADRLTDDIMYLLATETIRAQHEIGGTLFYNLHSSGTDGLRFFKERIGLTPSEVEWLL
jgi:hypothetical protein